MILGLIAAGVIRSQRAPWAKVRWLAARGRLPGCRSHAGLAGRLSGGQAHLDSQLDPVQRRLVLDLMAGFYLLIDVWGRKHWSFPLVVIGMNSIAAYCIVPLCGNFIGQSLRTHLGTKVFRLFGRPYEPLVYGALIVMVMWLLLYWMYRRKLFLRI